jgi:pyruvate dehydrogenase E2 component (dihydrolipoamide acetyltransferase)
MIVLMPPLSDSMEEATVVRSLKSDGETVERRDELVEIETDKATMTDEAEASGVLRRRVVQKGETVGISAPLAELLPTGADRDAAPTDSDARDAAVSRSRAAGPGETGPEPEFPQTAHNGNDVLAVGTADGAPRRIPASLLGRRPGATRRCP